MEFNVLYGPWIPVRCRDGSVSEVGLFEALRSSQEYIGISDVNPMREYGVYRFLFTFLMDAFRPENENDIEDLLDEGSFDMELISAYIKRCEDEGVSFDLFDENHPFLQEGPSSWSDINKTISIQKLDPARPSGNNHIHFEHEFEDNGTMTAAKALRSICATTVFCTAGVQGYPSSVNGAPPVFSIVEGRNLFETLVFGMVPASFSENYDQPLPYWRYKQPVESKKAVGKTSLLFGLTFPTRKVRLIADDPVKKMNYAQGLNFEGYDGWTDPYVSYITNEKGRKNIKPKMGYENWRNIGTLMGYRKGAAYVVDQYSDLADEEDNLRLITYSVVTSNASYLDMERNEYILSEKVIKSEVRFSVIREAIHFTEDIGKLLRYKMDTAIKKVLNRDSKEGFPVMEREEIESEYYSECKNLFFKWLCPNVEKVNIETIDELFDQWKRIIQRQSIIRFNEFEDRIGSNSITLMKIEALKYDWKHKS